MNLEQGRIPTKVKIGLGALAIATGLSAAASQVSSQNKTLESIVCPPGSIGITEKYHVDINRDGKVDTQDSRELCVDEAGNEVVPPVQSDKNIIEAAYNEILNSLKQ
jgi:hypothetical protein